MGLWKGSLDKEGKGIAVGMFSNHGARSPRTSSDNGDYLSGLLGVVKSWPPKDGIPEPSKSFCGQTGDQCCPTGIVKKLQTPTCWNTKVLAQLYTAKWMNIFSFLKIACLLRKKMCIFLRLKSTSKENCQVLQQSITHMQALVTDPGAIKILASLFKMSGPLLKDSPGQCLACRCQFE